MGVTKTEIFTEEQNKMAAIAKVLGHPARISIIQHISKRDSCICGDLVAEIGLAQPTISQHLRELKNIGIIKGSISGTSVCYCIDDQKWEQIQETFRVFFTLRTTKDGCC